MIFTEIQADTETHPERASEKTLTQSRPRGETLFPGITRHAQTLGTNRTHLHLVLIGERKSRSLIKRYSDLLKKEGRAVPTLPLAA